MKTKFEEYVEQIDRLIKNHAKTLHISELDAIVESIEDSPAGTGRMDFWLEDVVDSELTSRKMAGE